MAAEIILAQFGDRVWLVGGDEHIDDLLADTLPPGATVEFVVCRERREVRAMWERMTTDQTDGAEPWVINPLIVRRLRGDWGGHSVAFSPWSALLDAAANEAIAAAATRLAAHPRARVTLRQRAVADAPPGLEDLQRLRGQLIAAALMRGGVDAGQVGHDTVAADGDGDRIDLVLVDLP